MQSFDSQSIFSMGFPDGTGLKHPPSNAGGMGLNPGSARSPGVRNGDPRQHSCLENPMDREAWQATVYGVTKESDVT